MPIIIDSNIIIAALIKDSTTRKLIIDLYPDVYFQEEMLKEINKHKNIIKKKARIDEQEFGDIFHNLFRYIKILPNEKIIENKEKAMGIMQGIDPEDYLLLAAAFCFDNAVIWSDDPHLKKQTVIKTCTTAEIIKNINMFLTH